MSEHLVYSIIIPHKNIPKLLKRCLSSIPHRNDLEIIVVDDNSDSNIVDFENFPGRERSDVKIIFDKQGGGAGHARNLGLDSAKGKFVLFADADDWFTYCLDEMLDQYATSQADIIFFNAVSLDCETYGVVQRVGHLNRYIALCKENPKAGERALRYKFGEPWCKIVRKTVIEEHNIRFDEVPLHNDTTFSYMAGFYSKTAAVDEHSIYVVTYRENSLSRSIDDEKRLVRIAVFAKDERFRKDNNIKINGGILNWHYREAGAILLARNLRLFKKGVAIIKRYNPSTLSIYANIFALLASAAVIMPFRIAKKVLRVICRL